MLSKLLFLQDLIDFDADWNSNHRLLFQSRELISGSNIYAVKLLALVIASWVRYSGKDTPSPSQLAQKLLKTLPSILTQSFQIYVLGDTAFGTINLINQIRGDSFNHHGILGIAKTRTLKDGRKVSEIKTRGQQVYLNGLDMPVFLSWVWLKRDGKRVQRFVISTKQMKGKTIARWGGNGDLNKQLSSFS